MFLLKKPIYREWFLVSTPGKLVFLHLESEEDQISSNCFKFHYNYTTHLFNFLHKSVKQLNEEKNKKDFEISIDEETFAGIKNSKVFLRNCFNFEFVFKEDDIFVFFLSAIVDLWPSIILPNEKETKYFLDNTFSEQSFFFLTHKPFIENWKKLNNFEKRR